MMKDESRTHMNLEREGHNHEELIIVYQYQIRTICHDRGISAKANLAANYTAAQSHTRIEQPLRLKPVSAQANITQTSIPTTSHAAISPAHHYHYRNGQY
jgi:hypothetical protein